MATGIVGKPNGTRIITGSVHYGKLKKEAFNLETREYPDRAHGRTVLILGQRIKQEIVVINAPVAKKRASKKKVVVEA